MSSPVDFLFGLVCCHPCCCWPDLLQVYEVAFDRQGAFSGIKLAMALKGHKSKARAGRALPVLTFHPQPVSGAMPGAAVVCQPLVSRVAWPF